MSDKKQCLRMNLLILQKFLSKKTFLSYEILGRKLISRWKNDQKSDQRAAQFV